MTYLRGVGGKCVYYYFYSIDEVLGLCFLGVPTWCPFRAQFYFNGHSDELTVTEIHSRMDAAVARYAPDLAPLGRYHWSISQAE